MGGYNKGIEELCFSVVRRLTIQNGELLPPTLTLKEKLQSIQGIERFKIIPLGRGVYHILLHSMAN